MKFIYLTKSLYIDQISDSTIHTRMADNPIEKWAKRLE